MEIIHLDKIPHVFIIKNLFDKDEVDLIWKELKKIQNITPEEALKLKSAENKQGTLKKATGKWFHHNEDFENDFYILMAKVKKYFTVLSDRDSYYEKLNNSYHNILISYYGDGGYYKPHVDDSYVTACTYFFEEPKKFSGGNFLLKHRIRGETFNPNNFDIQLEVENNMTVIFPGHYLHQAKKVEMKRSDLGYGRYCISQFFKVKEND